MKQNKDLAPQQKSTKKKRLFEILLVAAIIIFGLWWVLPKSKTLENSSRFEISTIEETAKEVIQLLDKGDYDSLRNMSMEKFAPMINEEQMEAARKNLSEHWGKLEHYDFQSFAESTQRGKHSAITTVTVTYENTKVTYMISFNESMKLNGLQMSRPK